MKISSAYSTWGVPRQSLFEKSFLQSERLTLQLILTELILNTFQYEYNTKYEISMKVCPATYVCTSQKQHKQKKLVIVTEISFAILKKL